MSNTVIVTNIANGTAESTISEFFSFCGKITALKVTPALDGNSLTALITFESTSASKTSLLLSNALINERPITVQLAPEEVANQLQEEKEAVENPNIVNKPHELPPELRSATSVIASVLAAGYKLSEDALNKAKEFDNTTGFTSKVTELAQQGKDKLVEIDQKLGITEKARTAAAVVGEKVQALDQQYQISQALNAATAVFGEFARTASAAFDSLTKKASDAIEQTIPGALEHARSAASSVTTVATAIAEETKANINAQRPAQLEPENSAAPAAPAAEVPPPEGDYEITPIKPALK